MASVREANARLRAAQADVAHFARVAERERIARDLHDLLGHTLTVIRMKAQLASRIGGTDPARATSEVVEIERIAGEALHEVRSAVTGYRGEQQVSDALEVAAQTLATAGVQARFASLDMTLSPAHERVFALAIREAVTNVVRHACATTCSIGISRAKGTVMLEIRDDGVGARGAEGSGLWGMRARAGECGGSVEVEATGGTRVAVSLPERHVTADTAQDVTA